MSTGYVIPIDPVQLANRFSYPPPDDLLEFMDPSHLPDDPSDLFDSDGEGGNDYDYAERIEPLLARIPEREADLIDLYFLHLKRQADIASIFGVTQAAVSYRLARGLERIKFLLSIPQVTEEQLRADLAAVFENQIDVDILAGMWTTTCQSEVANRLGLTQGRVRHRFFRAVEVLETYSKTHPETEPYRRIFSEIAKKRFNILREVKLPQWANRGGDECL